MNFNVNLSMSPLYTVSGKFHAVHVVIKPCFIVFIYFFHFSLMTFVKIFLYEN